MAHPSTALRTTIAIAATALLALHANAASQDPSGIAAPSAAQNADTPQGAGALDRSAPDVKAAGDRRRTTRDTRPAGRTDGATSSGGIGAGTLSGSASNAGAGTLSTPADMSGIEGSSIR